MSEHPTSSSSRPDGDLPFRVFIALAEADQDVHVKEVEAFQRLLEDTRWCKSEVIPALLDDARERYTMLWKQHASADQPVPAAALYDALYALWWTSVESERELAVEDVQRLALYIARAEGGFAGFGAINAAERASLDELASTIDRVRESARPTRGPLSASVPAVDSQTSAARRAMTGGYEAVSERPVWSRGRARVRCVQVLDETHNIKTFRFRSTEGFAFSYLPGQFATLELEINDRKVLRSYTISSTPTRPDVIQFTVKRVPGGLVSNWLCDHVAPGFEMTIKGPGGRFSWVRNPSRKALFLSGGSGVTPLLSMARYFNDMAEDVDLVFFHGARALEDLVCDDELAVLERTLPSFRRVYCLSQPKPTDTWTGLTGHIALDKLRAAVPDFMSRTVYLCGPVPFMEASRRVLEEAGFPMENFYQESFGGAPKRKPRHAAPQTGSKSPSQSQNIATLMPKPSSADAATKRPSTFNRVPAVRETEIEIPVFALDADSPPAATGQPAADTKPVVVFTRTRQKLELDDDMTILDAAEELGIMIESSCRAGTCGTCKVKKIRGTVEMDVDDGLDDEEREEGYVLTCVGRPIGRVELDA